MKPWTASVSIRFDREGLPHQDLSVGDAQLLFQSPLIAKVCLTKTPPVFRATNEFQSAFAYLCPRLGCRRHPPTAARDHKRQPRTRRKTDGEREGDRQATLGD